MTTLITLLISLLGYGTPADYADYSEDQLTAEIETVQNSSTSTDGGNNGGWDTGQVNDAPADGGNNGGWDTGQ